MGLITRLFNFTPHTAITADEVDAEFDQLVGLVNGNLESANLKDGTIATGDLATATLNAFLKTVGGADLACKVGQTNVTFAGSSVSNVATVLHGLGRTPGFLLLTPYNGGVPFISVMGVGKTPTEFSFWGRVDDGSPATANFAVDWMAIG